MYVKDENLINLQKYDLNQVKGVFFFFFFNDWHESKFDLYLTINGDPEQE